MMQAQNRVSRRCRQSGVSGRRWNREVTPIAKLIFLFDD